MLVRRKIRLDDRFLAALRDNSIAAHDPRVEAAQWYVRHSASLRDARKVADTKSHGPLLCYRTRDIAGTPPLTVYFYLEEQGTMVCMVGLMCPIVDEL